MSQLNYHIQPVTAFEQNCSLLWDSDSREAAVVDPGGDLETLLQFVKQNNLNLRKIWVTHAHIDHAGGVAALAERAQLTIEGPHRDDAFWIDALAEQATMFQFPEVSRPFVPDRWLNDGDTLTIGEQRLAVVHCPGHTPGHVVFYHQPSQLALVGDVLFQGSIGRTDFPRGNHRDLIASIRGKLFPLGDDVRFIPGHGPMSTFGRERRHNPYCGDGG